MIKEITCETAIDYEYPPDGGKVPVLDAYDGCQLNCPYCFQWQNQPWNEDLLVKINFPEILSRELDNWDATQMLFVGSRSDPYTPLESRYRLTRQTLQILNTRGIPCYLSTKSNVPAFMEDIGLFLEFGEMLTIAVGQANLSHLRKTSEACVLPNLQMANRLMRLGIWTQVFITPVLPGITDVPAMIQVLDEKIPVFLDKLRLEAGSLAERLFFKYLKNNYPDLELRYRALVKEGTDPYYQELVERYQGDPRVQFVFGTK